MARRWWGFASGLPEDEALPDMFWTLARFLAFSSSAPSSLKDHELQEDSSSPDPAQLAPPPRPSLRCAEETGPKAPWPAALCCFVLLLAGGFASVLFRFCFFVVPCATRMARSTLCSSFKWAAMLDNSSRLKVRADTTRKNIKGSSAWTAPVSTLPRTNHLPTWPNGSKVQCHATAATHHA